MSTMPEHVGQRRQYNMRYVWTICLVAALGGLMFGYDWIVISGTKPFYERFFSLGTAWATGWAMGSALVGCLIGAVLSGGLSDRVGRKRLLILSGLVFVVSAVGTGLAGTFAAFNLWRVAGGIAIGLASNLSPMYIAEVAPAAVRGRLVSMNQLTIVIGILLAQAVNYGIARFGTHLDKAGMKAYVGRHDAAIEAKRVAEELSWQVPLRDRAAVVAEFTALAAKQPSWSGLATVKELVEKMNAERPKAELKVDDVAIGLALRGQTPRNVRIGWRWMFGVTAVPAALFFLLTFFVPESPRWLVKNGRASEARSILARIGGEAFAAQEVHNIERTLAGEIERVNFRDLLEPRMLKILAVGVILAVLQQWCGINVIFYYAADLFRAAGYGVADALLIIVIIGSVNLAFTVAAIFSVDRFGRRILMLLGFAGLTVLHVLMGVSYYSGQSGAYTLVLALAAIGCYALSLAPVTWVVLSEIFPNRIRGAAMSVSVFSLWTACFILTFTFPLLNESLGTAQTFWIYAAVCVFGFFFVATRLPETKGKTLEELEKELVG
jgi:MFS family permease